MRGIVNPRKSAAHKLACLSLYRSLLRQTSRFTDHSTSTTLHQLVRHRFFLDRRINSPRVICDALRQGREAHTLIRDAANGQSSALAQLTSTLDQAASHVSQLAALRSHQNSLRGPTSPSKLPKVAHLERQASKAWRAKLPNHIPVLQRPVPKEQLPNPDKPRRVPALSHYQGIPFLRYKAGSQSQALSCILKDLYMHDFKRWETVAQLQHEINHASLEDAWDQHVYANTGYEDEAEDADWYGNPLVKSWNEDTRTASKELQTRLKESASARTELTHKMWNVVQREKALAEKEKQERKQKGREEWRRKQQEAKMRP